MRTLPILLLSLAACGGGTDELTPEMEAGLASFNDALASTLLTAEAASRLRELEVLRAPPTIVVAPSQTLTNREYHKLREISIRVIRHLGIVGDRREPRAGHAHAGSR